MRRAHRLSGAWPFARPIWLSRRVIVTFLIAFCAVFFTGAGISAQQALADTPVAAAAVAPVQGQALGQVVSGTGLPCLKDQSCKPTQVSQPGDLFPMPDLTGGGQKTLFETYPFGAWYLDTELTAPQDFLPIVMNGVVNFLAYIWIAVAYGAIGMTWWLFGSLDVPGLSHATSGIIAASAGAAIEWLFPLSLVVGGTVAYLNHKRNSALGQLSWMLAAGALATVLLTSPQVVTDGISGVRQMGSNLILSVADAGVSGDNTTPLPWPKVDYTADTPKNAMLRKSGDTLWRAIVATPWCMAEFGSIGGCEKYGKLILDQGTNTDGRKTVITDTIYPTESNDPGCTSSCDRGYNSPTGSWVRGQDWGQRLAIVVFALVIALVMCGIMLLLGFSALGGVLLSFFLLVVGPFFAALWCIPGKPRKWGAAWFEALIGSVLTTFVALLTFSAVCSLLTAAYAASMNVQLPGVHVKGMGWLGTMGIGLAIAVTALGFHRRLSGMFGASETNLGRSALIGAYVAGRFGKSAASAAANTARRTKATAGRVRNGVRFTAGGVRAVSEAHKRRVPGQRLTSYYARAAQQGVRHVRDGGRVADVRQSMAASRARGEARDRVMDVRKNEQHRNRPQTRRALAATRAGMSRAGATAPMTARPPVDSPWAPARRIPEGERMRNFRRHAPTPRGAGQVRKRR